MRVYLSPNNILFLYFTKTLWLKIVRKNASIYHTYEEGLPMRNLHKYAQNLKKSLAALIAFIFFGFSAQANDILVVGQIAEPKALDPAAVTASNNVS